MRLRITLKPLDPVSCLPTDYNHLQASLVAELLRSGSDHFSQLMSDEELANGRRDANPFTFSPLIQPGMRPRSDGLNLSSQPVNFIISTSLSDLDAKQVRHQFSKKRLQLGSAEFRLLFIQSLPLPEFQEYMYFRPLSPLIASTVIERTGSWVSQYLLPNDDRYGEVVCQNLKQRYTTFFGTPPEDDGLVFYFDPAYVVQLKENITRLIEMKRIERGMAIVKKVRGVLAPFFVKGNPELARFGYLTGFGEKTSLGYGCCETI